MAHVKGAHPATEIMNTAIAGTSLWRLQPLAAGAYAADWQPVIAAEAEALRRFPDCREIIRAQVRAALRQIRDSLQRSGAYGPVERMAAVEFVHQIEQRTSHDDHQLHLQQVQDARAARAKSAERDATLNDLADAEIAARAVVGDAR